MIFPKDIIPEEITHVTVANYQNNQGSKMDNRPWYGIAFPLSGEILYVHNSKKIKLSSNTVVFIPKDSTYEVLCTKAGSFAVINFNTTKELCINDFISIDTQNIELFRREFLVMQELFTSNMPHKTYSNLSSLHKLFSLLANDSLKNDIPYLLSKAINYIHSHLECQSMCNNEIAEQMGISEVYLRKLFSKHLSVSVNQYIQNMRIEKAKILLLDTSLSVTEIAEKCGYSCVYYFCNAFKRKNKCTPTQYRNSNLQNLF